MLRRNPQSVAPQSETVQVRPSEFASLGGNLEITPLGTTPEPDSASDAWAICADAVVNRGARDRS